MSNEKCIQSTGDWVKAQLNVEDQIVIDRRKAMKLQQQEAQRNRHKKETNNEKRTK